MYLKDRKYTVYKHTAPSKKVYIGITGQAVEKRWKNGTGYIDNSYFYRAIKKYGWNNIQHKIIEEGLTLKEACTKEKELIAFYKSNERNFGYNMTNGGELTLYNKEMIDKMRLSSQRTGQRPSVRKQRSETMKKNWQNPSFVSKFLKQYTVNRLSDDVKEKLNIKPDENYTGNNAIIKEENLDYEKTRINNGIYVDYDNHVFRSISECSRYMNIGKRTLSQYLSGDRTISQEVKDKGLKYHDKFCEYIEVERRHNHQVFCDGMTFPSSAEADRYYGLRKDTIREWLTNSVNLGVPPEFQEKGLCYVNEKRYRIMHKELIEQKEIKGYGSY